MRRRRGPCTLQTVSNAAHPSPTKTRAALTIVVDKCDLVIAHQPKAANISFSTLQVGLLHEMVVLSTRVGTSYILEQR